MHPEINVTPTETKLTSTRQQWTKVRMMYFCQAPIQNGRQTKSIHVYIYMPDNFDLFVD